MNQTTASSLRKLAVGAALAFGVAAVSSSTACTVSLACPAGEVDCGGYCSTLDTDLDCGACGYTCLSTETCSAGACVPISSCLPDLSACSFDSDCCTGVCATGDGLCGCVNTNETGCGTDSDCCSTADLCVNGICQ
jgi:hypothetical protein